VETVEQTQANGAGDAPPAPSQRFILTTSLAELARQRREAVQEFELTATQRELKMVEPIYAEVRMVDLADAATLSALPETLLRKVLSIANDVEVREGRANPIAEDGSLNIERAIKVAQANTEAINAYCVAGFVKPQLIFTNAERTNDDQVLVSDIHPADRQRFFDWCQGRHAEAAATVAPFPGPRELDPGVDAGGPGGIDGGQAEHATEPAPDDGDNGRGPA
jgi:hypothetical protein